MWPLAIAGGIMMGIAARRLAVRAHHAGRPVLGACINWARWLVWGASIHLAWGLQGHEAPWTLTWSSLVWIAGGVAGMVSYRFIRIVWRTWRLLRSRHVTS